MKRRRAPLLFLLFFLLPLVAIIIALSDPDRRTRAGPAPTPPHPAHAAASRPSIAARLASATRSARAPSSHATDSPSAGGPTSAPEAGRARAAQRRLRPARGRVVEAGTGRPIAGAWVTWRPPPPKLADEVLSSPSLREAGGGLITDTEGRFEIERLPVDMTVASRLHAVAPGHAPGSAPVALGEVTIELGPAGALEVRQRALLGPELVLVQRRGLEELRATPDGAPHFPIWTLSRLAPGEWIALLEGVELGRATVVAGQRAVLDLALPEEVLVQGVVTGLAPEELTSTRRVVLTRPGARVDLLLDHAGAFTEHVPPGRYAACLEVTPEWFTETSLPLAAELEVRAGLPPLRFDVPGRVPVELEVRAPAGVELEGSVTLVGLTPGPLVFLTLDRVDAPAAAGAATLRVRGRVPPGAYGVFVGDAWAGRIVAGPSEILALDLVPGALEVRWRVDGLAPDEHVLGHVRLISADLPPQVVETLSSIGDSTTFEGPGATSFPFLAPGRYVLVGESDLGPFERELTLEGQGAAIEVELYSPR